MTVIENQLRQLQIRIGAIAVRCKQDDRDETSQRLRDAVKFIDEMLMGMQHTNTNNETRK